MFFFDNDILSVLIEFFRLPYSIYAIILLSVCSDFYSTINFALCQQFREESKRNQDVNKFSKI